MRHYTFGTVSKDSVELFHPRSIQAHERCKIFHCNDCRCVKFLDRKVFVVFPYDEVPDFVIILRARDIVEKDRLNGIFSHFTKCDVSNFIVSA